MDYSKLGLKAGIEIHQQLDGHKLFCNCPTKIREDFPHFTIKRKLKAVAGEHGQVDKAALQEQSKDKFFIYQGYYDTTCLVEADCQPPNELNSQALYTTLQFCQLVNSQVSPIVQVMRKTVVDGSNTSGFQRTALIARGGKIETANGQVKIENISLEEDAARNISETANEKIYRLDRLGIPLIEIGTAPDIKTPEQCQEAAKKIGLLLRSLPGVKRGLGTIRQDVNISILGGNRIEIKGAQDLKLLPLLVELEVQRQVQLLKIKEDVSKLKLSPFQLFDLTNTLKNSSSKILSKTIQTNGKILGLKFKGWAGFIGKELIPNYRLGTEFSGRAKVLSGVGGIFHSDELPNYGITELEVALIKKELNCNLGDAFVLVADQENKAKLALAVVYERAQEAQMGVPKEVRKANADGTTSFLRIMPSSARMYPETDVSLIFPETKNVTVPETLEQKIIRFQKQLGLSKDLAEFIAKSDKLFLFEDLVKDYPQIKPAFIAETLTSTLLEIKRKQGLDLSNLAEDKFQELFKHLSLGLISKDVIIDVLIDLSKGQFELKKYQQLSITNLHSLLTEIIVANKQAPFSALMGLAMKKVNGKVSGQVIAQELKKLLGN